MATWRALAREAAGALLLGAFSLAGLWWGRVAYVCLVLLTTTGLLAAALPLISPGGAGHAGAAIEWDGTTYYPGQERYDWPRGRREQMAAWFSAYRVVALSTSVVGWAAWGWASVARGRGLLRSGPFRRQCYGRGPYRFTREQWSWLVSLAAEAGIIEGTRERHYPRAQLHGVSCGVASRLAALLARYDGPLPDGLEGDDLPVLSAWLGTRRPQFYIW